MPPPAAPSRNLSPLSAKRQAALEARAAAEAALVPPAPHRVPTGTVRRYAGNAARRVTKLSAISMLRRGADLVPVRVAFGERTWIPAPAPTDRPLRSGDLVRLDVGCVFKGYYASLARMAVMGEPRARQQAACDAVQAGLEAAVDAVVPGRTAELVHEAGVAAVRAAGLEALEGHRLGHGLGLEPWEPPGLAAGDTTPLEPGEVLCVDVPYFEVGWAGVSLRDTVLVTTRGRQVMNRSTRALVLLD